VQPLHWREVGVAVRGLRCVLRGAGRRGAARGQQLGLDAGAQAGGQRLARKAPSPLCTRRERK
jgi:hypothetical protein